MTNILLHVYNETIKTPKGKGEKKMKDFEQFEKEARETKITISKAQFIDKAAEVCAKVSRQNPIVAMVAAPFVAIMIKAFFDEKDNDEENKKD